MPVDLVIEPLNQRVVMAIRLELTRQRVSQVSLGHALGHNQAFVSARLTGKTGLKLSEVEEIAHCLGVPVDRLLNMPDPLERRGRRASLWRYAMTIT
jgi:hypothetical protein